MRVDWVHPSWRDLVIESLAKDGVARRSFLRRCGVDGAALALSGGGGSEGKRERPLLRDDGDWDALGDGLYHRCAELDEAEAVRLLQVLADAGDGPELQALAALVLARLDWSGKVLSVDAIGAWLALAARLDPRPELPAFAMTWLELEPSDAPRTPEAMERMADWLRLAELLGEHDPELLSGLGFPERYGLVLHEFATHTPRDEPILERELRIETLARLAVLDPGLAGQALNESEALSFETMPPMSEATPEDSARFPVERVLRDLTPS
jgi:hypothetical protein